MTSPLEIDIDPPAISVAGGQFTPNPDILVMPGPEGPRGPTGGEPFAWHQTTASASWVITHGLGHYPQVSIADDTGILVLSDVVYTSLNVVTINFASPRTGYAYFV